VVGYLVLGPGVGALHCTYDVASAQKGIVLMIEVFLVTS